MKGKIVFRWSVEGKTTFNEIKEPIAHAPVLVCPNYTQYFIIYSYASEHTMSAILMQKNQEGIESPIAFMNFPLKVDELKYSQMEKHAYVIVKVVKYFKFYILNSHTLVLVPDTTVKSILTQQEFGTKRGNWIAKIQEYDLEIRPTKLVHGKDLYQLMTENGSSHLCDKVDDISECLPTVLFVNTTNEWYSSISHFLTYGDCPSYLSYRERRNVKLKVANFVIWDNCLYKNIDGVFPRCVDKVQQVKYYWPTLFKEKYKWVRKCDLCQQFVGKQKITVLPLKPVVIDEPFKQWGLDFIGVINPSPSVGHTYVLTATDYFNKWVEVIPVRHTTSKVVCRFLKENIICRFGVPNKIKADNAATFSSYEITQFFFEYGITLSHSSNYYPQALFDALWVDHSTPKRAIGMSPFQFLYGLNTEIPITLELPMLNLARAVEDDTYVDALNKIIMFFTQLEEQRAQVVDHLAKHQKQVKTLFDKKTKSRDFKVGDLVLL
ncbi:uncharacterized protein LOC131060021 [Cryptomeria japonica]|uniref:uncharacterized protein LOC131060021 n=1 Tax=Cryptomeria japonica TaxID=3369 RepID=UPI0027DA72C8|nr:uncharacterized protein LOC131060021 [Cryptomeria japonica]